MELVQHLDDKLLFAVPKKGRLAERCTELLVGADVQFRRSNRLDIAISTNLPVALVFLPAADIPTFVGEGKCSLGITGHDQVEESNVKVDDLLDLGFGKCKLQIQVPADGPYSDPKQLIGKTIVTSFIHLATTFFTELEGKQPGDKLDTVIKYVGGSVEAAVALGVADAIVDLVESGETMRAAGLKPIGTVLNTSAHLIASKSPSHPDVLQILKSRIEGVIASNRYVLCQYNAQRKDMPVLLKITPGRRAATVAPLEDDTWAAISTMVEKSRIAEVMDQLASNGAEDILVTHLANCRV
ncbi:ATP phosphoribosyltransferase [Wickerhamiella sorbophila]|uniref:ATP phosphoribosyltransferase n=1 Tax=Wickerhamiella sorbophila TaxID=45607 RepID=A0A2T0FMJ8_9ASCO|nr:ATP phosphoribosyltransferase [Wickerhamiella sorbophila]PRT56211.1 ATP phosphoribosyltransferase [Wickerhamiella sorbophila]